MAIRVYEYGCGVGQIEGLEPALDQMRRRIDFWNRLVEIDNDVRARMDALLFAGEHETELSSLRERLRTLLGSGSNARSGEVGGDVNKKSTAADELRSAIRAQLNDVKRVRKENAARHRGRLRQLDSERKCRIAEVQATAGLYWANRDEIRRKYEVARVRAMQQGRQLRPQQWNETGRIKVQFQRGLPVPKAFLQNGRLQIDPIAEAAFQSPRFERRRLTRTRIRIRVNANEDRSPVWLTVPAVLHRPLPPGGSIRGVSFVRERIGLGFRHRVLFTVSELAFPDSSKPDKAVGVDLGWRLTTDGLRVAYWAGADGKRGELVLPMADLTEFKRVGSLQATIVAAHEQARALVTAFRTRHAVPDELQDLMHEAEGSSAPGALLHLFEEWKTHRFAGDRYVFTKLRAWHKQYVHLWTWQANLRDQLLRRRRELYRRFAASLAQRYGKIFVNDIPLRSLAVKPPETERIIPIQRQHRFIAAISVLHRILQNASEKRGALLKRLKCEHATISCHVCGAVDAWSPRTSLNHRCSKCGRSWDQDYNAAMHALKTGMTLAAGVRA
jgi:transposase